MDNDSERKKLEHVDGVPRLPDGYHAGLVTAISLILSVSIAFLRFWSFEAPGSWSRSSIASANMVVTGIVLQLIALYRALDLKDAAPAHYRLTVRVFFVGIVIVIIGAVSSSIIAAIEGE